MGQVGKKYISLTLQRIRRAIHHGLISLRHVGLSLSCSHAKTPFVFSALFIAGDKTYVLEWKQKNISIGSLANADKTV